MFCMIVQFYILTLMNEAEKHLKTYGLLVLLRVSDILSSSTEDKQLFKVYILTQFIFTLDNIHVNGLL